MTSLKEAVSFHLLILLPQLIWDVDHGTGTTKNVLNAQPDGLSTPTESVFQYLIYVTNGMLPELAFHAIKDSI